MKFKRYILYLIFLIFLGLSFLCVKYVHHMEEPYYYPISFNKESRITYNKFMKNHKYGPIILKYSNKHNISPYLIHALMLTESTFDEMAKSNRGALGLMQVMSFNFPDETPVALYYDPDVNISAGSAYYAKMLEISGNEFDALRYYNCGPALARSMPQCGREFAKLVLDRSGAGW